LLAVLTRSYAGGQERGHIGLSRRIILERCTLEPEECLLGRLRYSQPQGVHVSQISLRCRIALIGGFEEPMHSFGRILLDADAETKGAGKLDLVSCMAVFGAGTKLSKIDRIDCGLLRKADAYHNQENDQPANEQLTKYYPDVRIGLHCSMKSTRV